MKLSRQISTYKRLREQALWRLLAAEHAPIILAILQKHFLDGDNRVPQSILYERVERDLEELKAEGFDLPQPARAYVASWLTSGFVERYFPPGASEEEYEISASAAQAIRLITSLIERRTSATESRLSTVIQQLSALVEETDANQQTRLTALSFERERLEAQIAAVKHGDFIVMDDAKAVERAREVIVLAEELIGDFRSVRDNFEDLNKNLRISLLEDGDNRGDVLEALFAGVDIITDSEAGRTFTAFWRLLTDPEQNRLLEETLDILPERPFAKHLSAEERLFLRRLIGTLLAQGGTVHEVLQNFARSLKSFVQSREFLEQRNINRLLGEAQRAAIALKDAVGATEKLEFELPLTSCRVRSLSQLRLLDPSLGLSDTTIAEAETADISLDLVSDLVSRSEIDFRELATHIRQSLDDSHQVSIAALLERFSTTQGLGTVIGYISIGSRHGIIVSNQQEKVSWEGQDGVQRAGKIPLIYFSKESVRDLA